MYWNLISVRPPSQLIVRWTLTLDVLKLFNNTHSHSFICWWTLTLDVLKLLKLIPEAVANTRWTLTLDVLKPDDIRDTFKSDYVMNLNIGCIETKVKYCFYIVQWWWTLTLDVLKPYSCYIVVATPNWWTLTLDVLKQRP